MFKVGDRVRRINVGHPRGNFPVGKEGVITKYNALSDRFVLDDDLTQSHDPHNLELVTSGTGLIRTVTRREIVPGLYGIVVVGSRNEDSIKIPVSIEHLFYSAEELREAAHTLVQIAEVLDDGE